MTASKTASNRKRHDLQMVVACGTIIKKIDDVTHATWSAARGTRKSDRHLQPWWISISRLVRFDLFMGESTTLRSYKRITNQVTLDCLDPS